MASGHPMPLMAGIWALHCSHISATQYGAKIRMHNAFATHSHGYQQQPHCQRPPQQITFLPGHPILPTPYASWCKIHQLPLTDSQVSTLEQLMVILHSPTKGSCKPPNKEQSDPDPPLRVGPSMKQPPTVAPAMVPAAATTMAGLPLRVTEPPSTTEATKTLILAPTSQPNIQNVDIIHNDDTMGISNCSPQPA